MELVTIQKEQYALIDDFLAIAGKETLATFRYFENREYRVLDNHLISYILRFEGQSIAYGHLDQEEDIIWLGVAIAAPYQGIGLGKLMVNALLSYAKLKNISAIQLAVDKSNHSAIALYEKWNFNLLTENDKVQFMKWINPKMQS